jgi:hypothetical protein
MFFKRNVNALLNQAAFECPNDLNNRNIYFQELAVQRNTLSACTVEKEFQKPLRLQIPIHLY